MISGRVNSSGRFMADSQKMRILVVKLSSLGDTLHALPTVAELKTQLGAEIHWAVQPEFSSLVSCFTCVDRVIKVPRPSDFPGFCRALREVRTVRYDLVVDLQGLMKSAVVARSARAPRRIGPSFSREGSRLLYSEVAGATNRARHAVDECLDVIRHLGMEMPAVPRFPLTVPAFDLDAQATLAHGGPRLAIAPVSRWKSKNWPEDYFAQLVSRLVKNHDARVYVIGGKADHEVAERILAASGVDAANLCGTLSLVQSLAVISKCEALVSNDSGPMHMGAALGVKCVVPFGPTSPERTGPYGGNHIVLRGGACPPCHEKDCVTGTHECLLAITPERVESALFG